MRRRQAIQTIGILIIGGISGCLSTDDNSSKNTPETTPETTPTTEIKEEYAKESALEAEQSHIKNQLERANCLDEWDTGSATVEPEARISSRADSGVYVNVTYPFSTTRYGTVSDRASTARYLITEQESRRMNGDDISPCSS